MRNEDQFMTEIRSLLTLKEWQQSIGIYSWSAAFEDGLSASEAVLDYRTWIAP